MSAGRATDQEAPGRGPDVRLVRLGPDRGLQRSTRIVIALIALAIAKPWTWGQPAESGAPTVPRQPSAIAVSATVQPTPAHDAVGAICHESTEWRVASIGEFVGARLREWAYVTPVPAEGPGDPAIPFAVFAFERAEALGYCAPSAERLGADMLVGVFLLDDEGAGTAFRITRLSKTPASSVAGLFEPGATTPPRGPAPAGTVTTSWQPGRYVFSLRTRTHGERWFGVELLSGFENDA